MNKPIRHGEILLQPIARMPRGKNAQHTSFIVGHSETGHHHVLESATDFAVVDRKDDLYVRLFQPGRLVHQKSVDRHHDLVVDAGRYKVIYKTEYNPFEKVIERVMD